MYSIKLGNSYIHDPERNVFCEGATLNLAVNEAGSLIINDRGMYGDAAWAKTLLGKQIVSVYRFNRLIWQGRILSVTEDDMIAQAEVTCEGVLAFLNDYYLEPYTFSGTAEEYLRYLCINAKGGRYGLRVEACDIETTTSTINRGSSDYKYLWDELKEKTIDSAAGGYISARLDGNTILLSWTTLPSAYVSSQSIVYGYNMLSMRSVYDGSSLCSGVLALGAVSSESDELKSYVTLSQADPSLTPDGFHIAGNVMWRNDLLEILGPVVRIVRFSNRLPNHLIQKAVDYLNSLYDYTYAHLGSDRIRSIPRLAVNAIDLADAEENAANLAFELGAKTEIIQPLTGDSLDQYLTSMTIDLLHPESSSYSFGALPGTLTNPQGYQSNDVIADQEGGGTPYATTHGYLTEAHGFASLAAGIQTIDEGRGCDAFGYNNSIPPLAVFNDGQADPDTEPNYYAQFSYQGFASHVEGCNNKAIGAFSHAEGGGPTPTGGASSYPQGNVAEGNASHVEGSGNIAYFIGHAEGYRCLAGGDMGNAAGEGRIFSWGKPGEARNSSGANHAEGLLAHAQGTASHAQNWGTIAKGHGQTAMGRFNTLPGLIINPDGSYDFEEFSDPGQYALVIGAGTSYTDRKNILTLDWDGNLWIAGKLTQG